MSSNRTILGDIGFNLTLERLARQLIENYGDFADAALVGIQPRGTYLARRLYERLRQLSPKLLFGALDITFFRDDLHQEGILAPSAMEMNFSTEDKRIILVDDVLYTGRTVGAAIQALQNLGRPTQIELLVMVERRFARHMPFAPDYRGVETDAFNDAYVRVRWKEIDGRDEVILYPNKAASKL